MNERFNDSSLLSTASEFIDLISESFSVLIYVETANAIQHNKVDSKIEFPALNIISARQSVHKHVGS
jgi:hypothetical protein